MAVRFGSRQHTGDGDLDARLAPDLDGQAAAVDTATLPDVTACCSSGAPLKAPSARRTEMCVGQ